MQEAEAGSRAGFESTTNTATVAWRAFSRLGRCGQVEMDNLVGHKRIMNQVTSKQSKLGNNLKEHPMIKLISAVLATVFALGSVSAIACGDKAKDEKQMSTPAKPKV